MSVHHEEFLSHLKLEVVTGLCVEADGVWEVMIEEESVPQVAVHH